MSPSATVPAASGRRPSTSSSHSAITRSRPNLRTLRSAAAARRARSASSPISRSSPLASAANVLGRYQPAIDVVPHDLAGPPGAVGDEHRQPRRHRFRHHVAETLVARGQDEQAGIVDPLAGALGDAGQLHAIGQPQTVAQSLELGAQLAIAPDHQAPLGMPAGDFGERRQQDDRSPSARRDGRPRPGCGRPSGAAMAPADRPDWGSRGHGHGPRPAATSTRRGSASPAGRPRRTGEGAASARPGSRPGAAGLLRSDTITPTSSPRVARTVMMLILARKEITTSGSIARISRRSTRTRCTL